MRGFETRSRWRGDGQNSSVKAFHTPMSAAEIARARSRQSTTDCRRPRTACRRVIDPALRPCYPAPAATTGPDEGDGQQARDRGHHRRAVIDSVPFHRARRKAIRESGLRFGEPRP